jgi:hypothetical protein
MTKTPFMPLPILVEKLEQHYRFKFRCDDRNGFLLSVLWAGDGDLHISIEADPDHEDFLYNVKRMSGSVRLRVPLVGGGSFEILHPALIEALRGEWARYKEATGEKSGPEVKDKTEVELLQDKVDELLEANDDLETENYELRQVIQNAYNYVPFSGICPICSVINPGKECKCKPGQYALTNPSRNGKN